MWLQALTTSKEAKKESSKRNWILVTTLLGEVLVCQEHQQKRTLHWTLTMMTNSKSRLSPALNHQSMRMSMEIISSMSQTRRRSIIHLLELSGHQSKDCLTKLPIRTSKVNPQLGRRTSHSMKLIRRMHHQSTTCRTRINWLDWIPCLNPWMTSIPNSSKESKSHPNWSMLGQSSTTLVDLQPVIQARNCKRPCSQSLR